jgi:hypothetical protein
LRTSFPALCDRCSADEAESENADADATIWDHSCRIDGLIEEKVISLKGNA